MRELSSVRAIAQELGGLTAIASVTNRSPKTAANWQTKNRLPADTHMVLDGELKKRECVAALDLFGWNRKRKS